MRRKHLTWDEVEPEVEKKIRCVLHQHPEFFLWGGEADVLAQEARMRVWRRLKVFDKKKAGLLTFLEQEIVGAMRDSFRKKPLYGPGRPKDKQWAMRRDIDEVFKPLKDDTLVRRDALADRKIRRAVLRLPAGPRKVVILMYWGQWKGNEIREAFGGSESLPYVQHREAIAYLRKILKREGEGDD